MRTIRSEEYELIKENVEKLAETWTLYLEVNPNSWYEFKYQFILSYYLNGKKIEQLLSTAKDKRFTSKVRIPKKKYEELIELVRIKQKLQSILQYPPFGIENPPDFLLINKLKRFK